jgi:peptide/nickel transport system substrate-binding protein
VRRAGKHLIHALLLVVLLSGGCGRRQEEASPPAPPSAPVPGGTAVIAFPADPDVLNSLIRNSAYAGQILALLQDGLVEMDENLCWQPKIAREWSLSPDGLRLTFHLRPWRWADGVPLTAQDVVSSLNLFQDPAVASPRRGALAPIVRAVAVDSQTVRYEFAQPQADPLAATLHQILPAHLTGSLVPAEVRSWPINERPLASGPFRLESWERNRQLVLVPNENYPGPSPLLARVVFRIIPDETARIIALETGEADFLESVPVTAAERMEREGTAIIHRVAGRDFGYLCWNCRNPLFADRRVRKALSLAIDRDRIITDLLGGYGAAGTSLIPPALWNHDGDLPPDPHDPQRARQLLAAAGARDRDNDGVLELGGHRFEFTLLTRQGDPVRENGAVIIRENLREVGIVVRPRIMELATAVDLVRAGRFDAYLGVFQANLMGDPSPQLHSSATDRYNYGHYHNTEVDSLLELGLSIADRARALPVWYRLQEVVAEDPPLAVLYYPETLCAASPRLQDVRPHLLSPYNNLPSWWIAPADRKYAIGTD